MNVNFEPIIEDLKVIFFTETKCKICFIYVGFNCKRKKWGKKRDGNYVHSKGGRGGPTLNGKFHFEFPFCFSEAFPNIKSNIELNHFSKKSKH